MPDPTLSEAIQEAYAHAPTDAIILHTLELRHPDFRDDAAAIVYDSTNGMVSRGDIIHEVPPPR